VSVDHGYRSVVRPEWTDENQHFNSVRYLDLFREAANAFLSGRLLDHGLDRATSTLFQGEAHIRYERELLEGAPVVVHSWLVGADDKRLHHAHAMFHAEAGYRAATVEYLHLHVALETRRVSPMPHRLRELAAELLACQTPLPEGIVGRRIELDRNGSSSPGREAKP
jgi:acyl-CoA thioester hydrolase